MSKISRYLENQVKNDLLEKMVFLGGPRQVGKTTLSKTLLRQINGSLDAYLNWDDDQDRSKFLKREFSSEQLWVFDEIHKYKRWRNSIKGLFDKQRESHQILVTGSARLDYYRFGGDSLQGRYHFLRLHPLTVAEVGVKSQSDMVDLLKFGGFPEPFFSGSEAKAKRWSNQYRSRLIHEDIQKLENLIDLASLELLMHALPDRVGSPLSYNALREDLGVAHYTVRRWVDILERTYHLVRVSPFSGAKIKAVKKEQKHYHWDWTLVQNDSFRFENCIAMHLLKWVDFRVDTLGENIELRYFRDQEGREVDFVIVKNSKPTHFIEVKWDDTQVSKSLLYLKKKYPQAKAYQVTFTDKKDFETDVGIRVIPARIFLAQWI